METFNFKWGVCDLYLKKIYIQGFKSFADKTEIEFKDEITAIVGPNGSGKSNISDAIRWVLGEQSVKSLRGNKMEDVIFSGTDKRRALGFAEVTITFDNKDGSIPIDYTEVEVTRRMFRSGESEYYINKNSCRLKDIRELFMDTGVGKDGYSIIGQGRIDEILSNRPEDRRSIFEEAAGIVKYKTKKEEAERRLDRTDNNLVRIKDLLHEVSNQKDILENESEKALQFTKLYSRLKDLEINIFIRDYKKLNKQIEDINQEKEKIDEDVKLLEDEKNIIDEKYNKLKDNIQSIELEIEESRSIKFDAVQVFENNRNKISLLNEKEKYLTVDLERLNDEKEKHIESLEKLHKSKDDLNLELETIQKDLNLLNIEYENNKEELDRINNYLLDIERNLNLDKDEIINLYNKLSDKKSEINSIKSFKENIDKRVSQLNKEIENINISILDLQNKYDELVNYGNELMGTLENKRNILKELNEKKKSIQDKDNIINDEIKKNQIKLHGLTSNYNLYKNMEEGYDGYYKSVKGLLQGAKRDSNLSKGLIGVVAELFTVDIEYERAIDVSLGSSVQHIVVNDENDAKKMVEYLKKQRLGRATFLPMNIIKGKTLNINPKDKIDFNILGLASELITYDKKYQNIFENLLGRTIVVRDIDSGIRLANNYDHNYRIVTLEGEVLNIGGSITGGSSGNNSISIISRRNKISSLKDEIHKSELYIDELIKDKSKLDEELYKITISLTQLESSIKDMEMELISNTNNKDNCLSEKDKLKLDIERREKEIESLLNENKDFENNLSLLKLDTIIYEENIEEMKEKININSCDYQEKKLSKDEFERKVTDLRIKINSLENHYQNTNNSILNFDSNRLEIENLIKQKEELILAINGELINLNSNRLSLEEEIKIQEKDEELASIKLNELLKKKDNFMKTFYDEQDRLKILNNKLSEIERIKNNLDVKLARYEIQLENGKNKIYDDYGVTIDESMKYETEIKSIQNAQEEVKDLKSEIKDLGNVNIGAIEDFKNIKERFEFLTKQQADLIDAKGNLLEVIKDMEKKMRSRFLATFQEINENFSETFSILFNGGKAYLEIEEGDDILNVGINIKAQPPGKKLQNLTLLSGGEKSLTAVALLFAILKAKPAPFCILDEIDAALDEANINRYTSYLKDFNDSTQFVLITHRKTTMEIADVLYGVTMEEEGVSKLVSVELKDKINNMAS